LARVIVHAETDSPRGWRYQVVVERDGFGASDHEVTLSWADHEYWCGGHDPPSSVVERFVGVVASRAGEGRVPSPLPARFDASTARRWLPELDALMLGRS
jgi:hypothetical protein